MLVHRPIGEQRRAGRHAYCCWLFDRLGGGTANASNVCGGSLPRACMAVGLIDLEEMTSMVLGIL